MGDQKTQQAPEHATKPHEKDAVKPVQTVEAAAYSTDTHILSRLSSAASLPPVPGKGLSHPTAAVHQAAMLRTLQRRQGNAFVQRAVVQGRSATGVSDHAVKQAQSDQSPGQSLDSSVQTDMEDHFGQDLSGVRIHTDGGAANLAQGINAQAFTRGQDIYFGAGRYQPGTTQGQRLLAHELTHTIQQQGAGSRLQASTAISQPTDMDELEADSASRQMEKGLSPQLDHPHQATPGIARKVEADPAPPPTTIDQTKAEQIAEGVYDALDSFFIPKPDQAITLLQDQNSAMRGEIQDLFKQKHKRTLRGYLKDKLFGEQQVKGFALLNEKNFIGYDTAMALALLVRFHQEEVFTILYHENLQGRRAMEAHYNATFGKQNDSDQEYIGHGSLKDDLKLAYFLASWASQKSIALLNRDLTSADILYFDSVGIIGTHTDAVISRIQDEWAKGPENFVRFERDWDKYIRNSEEWLDKKDTWTEMSLYQAMYSELSFGSWKLVEAVLDTYEEYKQGIRKSTNMGYIPDSKQLMELAQKEAGRPLTKKELEDTQLDVANKSLEAAKGIFSNDSEQVYKAISQIQSIWQQRIGRAETAEANKETLPDNKTSQSYKDQWNKVQERLKADFAPSGSISKESKHVLLLLSGELNMADEVYLAGQNGANNEERVMNLLIEDWAKGKMDELLKQTDKPKEVKEGDKYRILRPEFNVFGTVPTASKALRKIILIARPGVSDAIRGADLLEYYLGQGTSDSDLKSGYDFLKTTKDVNNDALRNEVIESFVAKTISPPTSANAVSVFMDNISTLYKNSNTVWLFKDLLIPTSDPAELLERARGRKEAADKGLVSYLTKDSPEEKETEESIARLEFIAKHHKASPDELQGMMAMAGIDPTNPEAVDRLANMEYKAFQARLDELRALRETVVEVISTIAQLVAEMAITILTAGTTAPALLATLGGIAANIMAHKLLLPPQEYEVATERNLEQLVVAVASYGFSSLGESVASTALSAQRIEELSHLRAFAYGAIKESFTQTGTLTVQAAFDKKAPSAEGMLSSAINLFGSSFAAGVHGSIAPKAREELSEFAAARRMVIADGTKNLISGIVNQSADFARTGTGSFSGGEIAKKLAIDAGKNVTTGFVSSMISIKAKGIAEERQRKKQGETDNPKALEDAEQDPSKLPTDQQTVTAPAAAVARGPQRVTVSKVNEEHVLSVRHNADGTAFITLCSSPACGRLRLLLEAAHEKLSKDPATPADILAELKKHLNTAESLEPRLANKTPDAAEKQELENLAGGVRMLLGKIGENNIFGTSKEEIRTGHKVLSEVETEAKAAEVGTKSVKAGAKEGTGSPTTEAAPGKPPTEKVPPKPEPPMVKAERPRLAAEVQKYLKQEGLTTEEILGFSGGMQAQQLSRASAARVERLLKRFTPKDLKELGKYLWDEDIVLNEDDVSELIEKVRPGEMGARVLSARIAQEHGEATRRPVGFKDMPELSIKTMRRTAEDHHIATRYRKDKKNQAIFKSLGLTIDDDLNLIKEFPEHGQLRGWYEWKDRKWKFVMKGHHREYNDWVTGHIKPPDGLPPDQALSRIVKVLRKLNDIIQKYPYVLSYGPKSLPEELQHLTFD